MLNIKQNVNLAILSSFHIGGPAEYFVEVKTAEEAVEAVRYAHSNNLHPFFLGAGSNVLFPDEGLKGLIIRSNINFIEQDDTKLTVGSGVYTTTLAQKCLEKGLSGIEALFGLPGTIGGAIRGNAGTLGTEIKDVLSTATIINDNFELQTLTREELDFAYRGSNLLKKHPMFITQCVLNLTQGETAAMETKMIETKNWRREKQPGGFTGGSFFKNPPDTTAGYLIDTAGLKGFSIGGAQVSTKHANFITNTGRATSKDVMMLSAHIQQVVKEKFGIELVPEVHLISFP